MIKSHAHLRSTSSGMRIMAFFAYCDLCFVHDPCKCVLQEILTHRIRPPCVCACVECVRVRVCACVRTCACAHVRVCGCVGVQGVGGSVGVVCELSP